MTANSDEQRFLGASVIGPSHTTSGKPNQDARGGFTIGNWTVLAVADGHGGARYVRSDRGSRFAIEAVRAAFLELTEGGSVDHRNAAALNSRLKGLPQAILRHWRAAVIADLAADPEPSLLGNPLVAYGSTCIAAAFAPGIVILTQLGDGDILVAPAAGALVRPLAEDQGLEGQQTYSLCLETAEQHFRTALFTGADPLAAPRFAQLSTDGLAKSFADEGAFVAAAEGWSRVVATRKSSEVSADLEGWLAQCTAAGSGDDTTVMMFVDPGALQAAQLSAAAHSQGVWVEPAAEIGVAPPARPRAASGLSFALGFLLGALSGGAATYLALAKDPAPAKQVTRELNTPAAGEPISERDVKPIAIPPMPGVRDEGMKPAHEKGEATAPEKAKEKGQEKGEKGH